MWYVYLLQNKHGRWYIGSTNNLQKRILSHNNGKNQSTKHWLPWKLIYCEICIARDDAREKYLKSGMGRKYLKNRLKFFFVKGF